MLLNELHDNPGARKRRMRVGRGIGSGKGKTSGRGVKGQLARTGAKVNGFEGGQMPIYRRLPKRGFNNISAKSFAVINLDDLQAAIDAKRLDAGNVTEDSIIAAGLTKQKRDGVRLLGRGKLTAKVSATLSGASKAAVEAVEKAGGKITLLTSMKVPAESKSDKKSDSDNA